MAAVATDGRSGDRLDLHIEKLVAGGQGLARHQGRVVLVDDAAPGDRLDAIITETHKGYLKARAVSIREPGAGRREPPCPHAVECGGCSWQHLGYDAQVEAKLAILKESFVRVGKLEPPADIRVHRSPEWGYRRRARFHQVRRADGPAYFGFFARDSRRVVDLQCCPVLVPAIEQALPRLRAEAGTRREVEVTAGEDRAPAAGEAARLSVLGELLEVPAGAFFQANAPLLDAFAQRVVELAVGAGDVAVAADLFAGVGLFTLPLARRTGSVIAVEGSATTASALSANLKRAGLDRVRVEAGAVDAFLAAEPEALKGGAVIVDPPREGLAPPVLASLAAARCRRIVYVACDPVSLARDSARLVGEGFTLQSLDLFDLFPQTHHLETVALLESPL